MMNARKITSEQRVALRRLEQAWVAAAVIATAEEARRPGIRGAAGAEGADDATPQPSNEGDQNCPKFTL